MTGSSTVISRSALVTITIPSTIGSSDPLLALIVGCCPPYQTTTTVITTVITTTAKGVTTKNDTNTPPLHDHLSVTVGPDTYTQRNAILRCLCGPGYHGALDTIPHLLLLGGHYASTAFSAGGEGGACKSPVSACAMASIASWMSVASSIRDNNNKEEDVMLLLSQLNVYLATRSFVIVPSPRPTLADLDLYFALLSRLITTGPTTSSSMNTEEQCVFEKTIGGLGNVRRWLHTCSVTVNELMDIAMKNSVHSKVPMVEIPMLDVLLRSIPRPTPIFFYGNENEDGVAILSSTTTTTTTTSNATSVATTVPTAGGGGQSSNAIDGGGLTDEQKKASAEKKAKKNAEKAAAKAKDGNAASIVATSESSDLTVAALDIRVGRIIKGK
jgi:hypothetical protein